VARSTSSKERKKHLAEDDIESLTTHFAVLISGVLVGQERTSERCNGTGISETERLVGVK
jgi:hypothetical protein